MIRSALAIALSLVLLVSGCKETRESLGDAAVADVQKLTEVLKGVTDNATAQEAKPKIDKIVADMKDKYTKLKAMEKDGTAEETRAFRERFGERMREATAELMRENVRIRSNHEITTELNVPML